MNSLGKSEDLPILSILCLAFALLPLAFLNSAFDVFGTVKYTILVILAVVSGVLQLWLTLATGRARLPAGRLGLAMFVLLAWLTLSTAFSPVAAISFFGVRKRLLGLMTYLAAALLMLAAARVLWDKTKLKTVYYSACLSIVVASLIGVAQYFGSPYPFDLRDLFNRSAYSTFGNPNYFGLFLALLLPVPWHLALDGETWPDRLVGYGGVTAALIGLATAGSAGAIVGGVGGVGAFLIWRYVRLRGAANLVKPAAAILAVIVLAGSAYAVTQEKTSLGQRLWIWQAAFDVAADQPIFGTGLDNLKTGLQRLGVEPELKGPGGQYEDAHNIWLNLAAQAGWPALLLALALFILVGLGASKAWDRNELNSRMLPVIVTGGFGYLIAAQFNPEDLGSLPLFWIFVGIAVSLSGAVKPVKVNGGPGAYAAAAVLIGALGTGAFFAANALTAEINLLNANNARDLPTAQAAFQAAQSAQPWQTQYYMLEIYRLLPSVGGLKTPAGREVVRAAQTAVAESPQDPDNWIAFGQIYRTIGEKTGDRELHKLALGLFRRAMTLDKYNNDAIQMTALTYSNLNQPEKSLEWIKKYERLFDPDPELVNLKQSLLNASGNRNPDKL